MFYHSTGHLNTEAAERRIEELVRDPNVEVWFDGDMIHPKPENSLKPPKPGCQKYQNI